jgi:hypothetical protein
MTVKDATPLGRIDEIRQRLRGATRFSAFDLMSGYHQLQIRSTDIPRTAFNTRYGHFEWVVMPFGLCNAPATFQRWINRILGDLLDDCVIAYLDDLLIYSSTESEHVRHIEQVLTRLAKAGAFLNLDKSFFNRDSVNYLGHVVSADGISIRPDYVDAVLEWPQIIDKHDVQSCCGLVNFFKDWLPYYADLLLPLNELRKKDVPFSWNIDCQSAVRVVQHAIASAPVLEFFDPGKLTTIYSDASAFAIGGWIGQRPVVPPEAPDRPILYWSRKCKPPETRYGTHERELLALLELVRIGRPYIEGRTVTAKTDHQALKWLQTQPTLSRRQAAWVERLQSLDLTIEYLPGKFNTLADILSRRPDFAPNCPKCNSKIAIAAVTYTASRATLIDRIIAASSVDDFARRCIHQLRSTGGESEKPPEKERNGTSDPSDRADHGASDPSDLADHGASDPSDLADHGAPGLADQHGATSKESSDTASDTAPALRGTSAPVRASRRATLTPTEAQPSAPPANPTTDGYQLAPDGTLRFRGRLYVPDHETLRYEVIQSVHDRIHLGITRTIDAVLRDYYWPGCGKDVKAWIASCDACQRHKPRNRAHGSLRPLPVPERRFADYAMDFFDPPSRSHGFDAILLVIDRLRKYLTLIPCNKKDTAVTIAHRFVENVVRHQGLPSSIVVDRDSKWTSRFWTTLAEHLGIRMELTTARHQQANGLAESGVNIVKTALRTTLGATPTDWFDQLAMIELAYNATPHTTTGFSPFELTFGQRVSLSALEKLR